LRSTVTAASAHSRQWCHETAADERSEPSRKEFNGARQSAIMAAVRFGLGMGQPLSLIWIAEAAPTNMRGAAVGVRLTGNRLGQVAIPAIVGGVVGSTRIGAVS
jgi:hypothetical protein